MPFHWHKEWEIIQIRKGAFTLNADGDEYHAKAGDVLLIRDGMLHGGTPEGCIYECFVFDFQGLLGDIGQVKKYLRPFYKGFSQPFLYFPRSMREITAAAREIMAAFSDTRQIAPELAAVTGLCRFFLSILNRELYREYPEGISGGSRKITQLKAALEYIELHYMTPLTLTELSGAVGMSPNYFCRFFCSVTHQTPMDYVNYYRIEQAARRLIKEPVSITEIGLECGFNDSSYFSKTFQKYKGMTPGRFRKENS